MTGESKDVNDVRSTKRISISHSTSLGKMRERMIGTVTRGFSSQPDVLSVMKYRARARAQNQNKRPDLITTKQIAPHLSPLEYICLEWKEKYGNEPTIKPAKDIPNLISGFTAEEIESYDMNLVKTVRTRDLDTLREMYASGRNLRCGNKFGESIMHFACRRGYVDVVSFLINEANICFRVKDDYGRTPMHDALWTTEPNFELVEILLEIYPDLVFVSDDRGHTPFEYVRKEHQKEWVSFLSTHMNLIYV